MRTRKDRAIARGLWVLYGVLGLAGLGVLADTLFRIPKEQTIVLPSFQEHALRTLELGPSPLAERRMTRRIAAGAAAPKPSGPVAVPLEGLIKLTGLLDFGGKQPTLAVLENPATGLSKAYKAGDRIGETGIVLKDVKDYLIVEYERRRFRVTFQKIEEVPADAVGTVER